jgi:hypothetical protein
VKAGYSSVDDGMSAIARELRTFYGSRGSIDQQALARTVTGVQNVYRNNVFPAMNVTFGSYPDNRGHNTSNGCFRCHDDTHAAKDGSKISGDCDYCHKEVTPPEAPSRSLKQLVAGNTRVPELAPAFQPAAGSSFTLRAFPRRQKQVSPCSSHCC